MNVRVLNGANGRELNASVLTAVALSGIDITRKDCFCWFEVDDWLSFLQIVWRAFAWYSRNHTLTARNSKISVEVVMDDSREYNTYVWFDDVYKGLRYVSLYR